MTASKLTGAQARPDALVSCRTLLDPFLRAAVQTMPLTTQRIAGYHLGWLDRDGRLTAANPGKAIRPALALLAAEAVGGTEECALPAAAAVELVHNFSLVHDDVIDRDATRRHRPTAWKVFGLGEAILVGDALLALAYDVLAMSGHAAAQDAAEALSAAVLGMIEGQYADLSFERRADVELSECFAMVEGKTALLMSCACTVGALFGGGRPDQVEKLGSFGVQLGFAFQLVDDLLGIWGDPEVTGKPVHSDLQRRKKSLPVVAALTSGTDAGEELAAVYHEDKPMSAADLVHACRLVERAGGRAWGESQRDFFMSQALHELDEADLTKRADAALRFLAGAISGRDH